MQQTAVILGIVTHLLTLHIFVIMSILLTYERNSYSVIAINYTGNLLIWYIKKIII